MKLFSIDYIKIIGLWLTVRKRHERRVVKEERKERGKDIIRVDPYYENYKIGLTLRFRKRQYKSL